jgi:NAD/NADP transhydrogenase alpha subunit
MAFTTSSIPVPRRREFSRAAALLLTIGGNILVFAIAALGVAGVALAAVAVFGGAVVDAL